MEVFMSKLYNQPVEVRQAAMCRSPFSGAVSGCGWRALLRFLCGGICMIRIGACLLSGLRVKGGGTYDLVAIREGWVLERVWDLSSPLFCVSYVLVTGEILPDFKRFSEPENKS